MVPSVRKPGQEKKVLDRIVKVEVEDCRHNSGESHDKVLSSWRSMVPDVGSRRDLRNDCRCISTNPISQWNRCDHSAADASPAESGAGATIGASGRPLYGWSQSHRRPSNTLCQDGPRPKTATNAGPATGPECVPGQTCENDSMIQSGFWYWLSSGSTRVAGKSSLPPGRDVRKSLRL